MKMLYAILSVALGVPSIAGAQYPPQPGGTDREFGRPGEFHPNGLPARENPVITTIDLEGPLQPADFQKMFVITDDQTREYTQVYDSFTVATSELREAAKRRMEQLGTALGRDTAAVGYYRERLKELGKTLRGAQSQFDERMKKLLSKEQQKQYRDWRKRQEDAARSMPPPSSKRRSPS